MEKIIPLWRENIATIVMFLNTSELRRNVATDVIKIPQALEIHDFIKVKSVKSEKNQRTIEFRQNSRLKI